MPCRHRWWSIATRPRQLGIDTDTLRTALYGGFGTDQVSTIFGSADSYEVITELDPKIEWSPERMLAIQMRTASGSLVPLGAFARVDRTAGALTVNQLGQLPAVTISYNLPQGVALGDSVTRINALKEQIGMPTAISTTFAGTAKTFQDSLANQGLLIGGAILTIYIVLGILYESFIHPLTILTGLPSAVLGALVALRLRRHGPVGHRGHRHPDADRHRQEERHHDGRRRAGTQTRGHVRHGVHPQGLPDALPADHDDDAGGADGHVPDRARHRRQRRTAPAARRCRGRRPARFAGADAVRHAGDLCLHGEFLRLAGRAVPKRTGGTAAGRSRSTQPSLFDANEELQPSRRRRPPNRQSTRSRKHLAQAVALAAGVPRS